MHTSQLSPLSQVSLRHHQAMDVLIESHRKSQSSVKEARQLCVGAVTVQCSCISMLVTFTKTYNQLITTAAYMTCFYRASTLGVCTAFAQICYTLSIEV